MDKTEKIASIVLCVVSIVLIVDGILAQFFNIGVEQKGSESIPRVEREAEQCHLNNCPQQSPNLFTCCVWTDMSIFSCHVSPPPVAILRFSRRSTIRMRK